jgi:hypothetical protein
MFRFAFAGVALVIAATSAAADEGLAYRPLCPSDDRLYCHAEGGRWRQNSVRRLATQGPHFQHQRCVSAHAEIRGKDAVITPAHWSDVALDPGPTDQRICRRTQ